MTLKLRSELVYVVRLLLAVTLTAGLISSRAPNLFFLNDAQTMFTPAAVEIGRSLRHGEFPLLSSCCWCGGNFAGEYLHGVFSVFLLACFAAFGNLPASLLASTLIVVHLWVLAAGSYWLVRRLGGGVTGATLAGLGVSLNGCLLALSACWPPVLYSLAWLPWFWAALLAPGRRSWVGAGISLSLLASAGWPYTLAFSALAVVSALYSDPGRWRSVLAALTLGMLLSSPAWLSLLEFKPTCQRDGALGEPDRALSFCLEGLASAFIPDAPVTYLRGDGPYRVPGTLLAGALIPLLVVLTAGRANLRRRSLRVGVGLGLLTLGLALGPRLGYFRYTIRWLVFWHFNLNLLAGCSLEAALARVPQWRRWAGLAIALTLILGWTTANLDESLLLSAGLVAFSQLRKPVWLLLTVWSLLCAPYLLRVPWLFNDNNYAQVDASPWPFETHRLYFQLVPQRVQPLDPLLRPDNLPMYSGLDFVNGYTGLLPRSLNQVLSIDWSGNSNRADDLITREAGPTGLLQLMGVDGMVVPPAAVPALLKQGWTVQARTFAEVLLHRVLRSPLIRAARYSERMAAEAVPACLLSHRQGEVPILTEGEPARQSWGPVRLDQRQFGRNEVSVAVRTRPDQPGLLIVSRLDAPGYRADLDGRPCKVVAVDGLLVGVELPPGAQGRLTLRYRPLGLWLGVPLAGLTMLGLLGLTVADRAGRSSPKSEWWPDRQSG